MAGSVTEAQSHDEGRGGRSVTGVHENVYKYGNKAGMRTNNKTTTRVRKDGGKEEKKTSYICCIHNYRYM